MNAASVQLKCPLDGSRSVLLCGDASPGYLKDIHTYDIIQLPHHGQEDDAKAIFEMLDGNAYSKEYIISDNTGSAQNSGGSDDLVTYMQNEEYDPAYNTKNGIVELPGASAPAYSDSRRRVRLGDLDCI